MCTALWHHVRSFCWFVEWISISRLTRSSPKIKASEYKKYCINTFEVILKRNDLPDLLCNCLQAEKAVMSGTIFIHLLTGGDFGYAEIFKYGREADYVDYYLSTYCKKSTYPPYNQLQYYTKVENIIPIHIYKTGGGMEILYTKVPLFVDDGIWKCAVKDPKTAISRYPNKWHRNWFDGKTISAKSS